MLIPVLYSDWTYEPASIRSRLCIRRGLSRIDPLCARAAGSARVAKCISGFHRHRKAQHGSTAFDAAAGIYRIAGGGGDVWGAADDFRFTWVKVTGNAALSADVNVAQPSTYPKAKGMLMFRESLDPGSPYADISLHADGHITLAWRAVQGGPTKDTDLPEHGSVHLRIVREGNHFTAYASSGAGGTTSPASITIPMPATAFVGLGVCSHDTNALQTVAFSSVAITQHGVRAEILPAAQ